MVIFKILKKYVWLIVLVMGLLYIQARCDLALPSYLSDIANVGVQQRGITDNAIKQIRVSEFEKLCLFTDKADEEFLRSKYSIQDGLMIRKTENADEIKRISEIFVIPMAVSYNISNLETKEELLLNIQEQLGLQIDADSDLYTILSNMPEEISSQLIAEIKSGLEGYGSMMNQISVVYIIDEYQANGFDLSGQQSRYILIAGLKMIAFTLLIVSAVIAISLISTRVAAFFSRDARKLVFEKVLTFSGNEFNDFSTASLITRCTNDIQQIQMMIQMTLRMVMYAPILGIGALIKIKGSNLMWVIGLAIACMLLLILFLLAVAMPKFSKLQKITDKLNLITREIITGLPVIRAFSRSDYEEKRFESANSEHSKTQLFVVRVMSFMMPVMSFVMSATSLLIVWVGAKAIDNATIMVGDLMSFTQYSMMIIMSFLALSMISIQLPRAMISIKRINEVINKESSIKEPQVSIALDTFKKGAIIFKNVSFKYPGAEGYALNDISFSAQTGETVAIIGSTGSGKTTLINLIPRFFDVTEGEVSVCGIDVRKAALKDLRGKIGYVPQKAFLFSGTIESNIAFALEDYGTEQIETAAEISQASGFINEKDDKYSSEISQGGTNVSGGQRQRLSIARAVAKNPDIYIFDDSFSALDFKTDIELRKALGEKTSESTKIIVAQRISTVMAADKILVLENGSLAGIGTHKELMQNCAVYRDIALSQLSEKEAG